MRLYQRITQKQFLMRKHRFLFYCLSLFLLWGRVVNTEVYSQDLDNFFNSANQIADSQNTLDVFYDQLRQLERARKDSARPEGEPYKISIMHIGDSHIQAGFFTVEIMNALQKRFGSAGRGLIFPLKLARTNEPYDYLIRSRSKWDRTLCVQGVKKLPIGLGGLAIKTADPNFTFEIKASNAENDHSFDKVTIFHHIKAPELKIADPNVSSSYEKSAYPFLSVIHLDKAVNHLYLAPALTEKTDSAIYYGFNLENGNSGILYHAVGINGAQFRHYASVQDFAEQISTLKPSLLIFSLGTNESFRGSLVKKRFFSEIDRIIKPILSENPEATVLITTPPDCLSGAVSTTRKSNPVIREIQEALIEYASDNKFAYWDLYTILGGDNSAYPLFQKGYLAEDGVHFRKKGYTLLGDLFVEALLNNYSDYVQHRPK